MSTAGSSKGRCGKPKQLHEAEISLEESMRWIGVKMTQIGFYHPEHGNLLHLKTDMNFLSELIQRGRANWISNEEGSMGSRSKIGDGGGKSSSYNASVRLQHILRDAGILIDEDIHRDPQSAELLDLTEGMHRSGIKVGEADGQFRWEIVPELTREILLQFEEKVGDIGKVFKEEKIRKEAMAMLRFGFRLPLFAEQIDKLRHEVCRMLRSYSPENEDIRSTMMKLISEPYASRICKLGLISDRITMLQRMDPDFDSIVKSAIIKLKSESFLSAMEDESRGEGQEDSMEMEEKRFAAYCLYCERIWGNGRHSFEKQTVLSPMQFTHCTTRHIPSEVVAGSTLQIYSIKVTLVDPREPLPVYGVVAVRDAVDRHRNPLFLCSRTDCQILEQKDSFLCLTGPVRAIVSMDTVYIEIQLIVKGTTESEDTSLISTFGFYNGDSSGTYLAKNDLCTVELCYEQLKQSVQATILSLAVIANEESLPFPHGGRVVCSLLPQHDNEDIAWQESTRQVLLVDSKDGRMPMTSNGYLDLARNVVSVELNGKLEVLIMADTPSQTEVAARFLLTPQKYNTSKCECPLANGSKVEITVAWSLVPSPMLQSGDSSEDSGMETAGSLKGRSGESVLSKELWQAAIFMQQSICWIKDLENKMVKKGHYGSKNYNNILQLKFYMHNVSKKLISAMTNPCWITDKGELTDTHSGLGKVTRWISVNVRSVESELMRIGNEGRTVQTQSKIGDGGKSVSKQYKELSISNSMSIAESVRNKIEEAETVMAEVVPSVSFKCLLSEEFDELWDNMRQLVSTEPKLLAICMLIREPFARYCSTLKFISAIFYRLGEWVPDFGDLIESMKSDQNRVKGGMIVDALEAAKKAEEYYFNAYRKGWERRRGHFGSFEDTTSLSPMHFAQSIPGHTQVGAEVGRTMQVYSIKVAEREGFTLDWPLKVYGVVAARDDVDYRRNLLFHRTRDDYQILTRGDPFLHLTGPSRAIISNETVTIEFHVKLKGTMVSEDTTLIRKAFSYDYDSVPMCQTRGLCDIELWCDHLEQSHQATILGVRVVEGSLPCGNGIKIFCSAQTEDKTEGNGPFGLVLLFDSRVGKMPVSKEGYLDLSRQVVSVKSGRRLEILMVAGKIRESVSFPTQFSNISEQACKLGDCMLMITVAWSLLIENQYDISVMGSVDPYSNTSIPQMPIMKLPSRLWSR